MHVRGPMVVGIDRHAQPIKPQDGRHSQPVT
jgi:hypothetical protein